MGFNCQAGSLCSLYAECAVATEIDQVRSGHLFSPLEPLVRGYFVAPSKENKIQDTVKDRSGTDT